MIMTLIQDFKKFAMRGNVLDLAVAVVIGAAFGRIVTSLVNDVIMPPIGFLMGGIDFSDFRWTLSEATAEAAAVTVNYGFFYSADSKFSNHCFCHFYGDKSF